MMQSIDPTTGNRIRVYAMLSQEQLADRLEFAASAYDTWRQTSPAERAKALTQLGQSLMDNLDELASLITQEMGKPLGQSRAEVEKCSYVAHFYAEQAATMLQPQEVHWKDLPTYVRFDPLGMVLAVMPWNFPLWQVFRQAVPAIAAGNVVLLKHAANVPGCGCRMEQVFSEAGFPPGVFTNLLIGHEQVEIVLDHPKLQAISLTGSERAASIVASAAARRIKKSVLELGGSDPFIVLADADLDVTIAKAVQARTINAGQSCIAAKRFLVAERIYDEFVRRFSEAMQKLRVGDPRLPDTDIGPLARGDLVEQLHDQVTRSLQQGAILICGGNRPSNSGFFYPPTILANVKPGMAAFDEETFGPVAAITAVPDDDTCILELANQSRFGLGASIWTADHQRGQQLAANLECGSVFINEIVQSDPHLPFGGIKLSGYGRELSEFGIREFTNIKTVYVGS